MKISEKNKKYLGIDWGAKRIGLAIGDGETHLAMPLGVVSGIDDIINTVESEEVNMVVVGLPYQIAGKDLPVSQEFKKFLTLLKNNLNIPVVTIDERLSSKAADSLPGDKKQKAQRDAIAAMLILQSYFDKKNYG